MSLDEDSIYSAGREIKGESRIDRIELAMFGPNNNNGVYGDLKDLRQHTNHSLDALDDKITALYKMLAITALSVLGSGLGVVVTLLSTAQ